MVTKLISKSESKLEFKVNYQKLF